MVDPRRIRTIEDLREFLREFLAGRGVRVYLFGSRARGEEAPHSDVDLAFEGGEELGPLLAELEEILEESLLPQKVDLVDLRVAGEELRRRVLEEGKLWVP
ncbi:nucleotidyltransferase family protein [Thermosulfurimonas sp. F29]|uniref:nucleotidyltransferase family protein n=1 Tax=Thermosulfurimonas sp. F29 TaxID=2867247 RepID=UPI001C83FAB9|nr:nucleotidyltransferase domain-containing protein [Thermosulfurimonas sp. F29]MBX6423479.1 nucleotidyltransferase domain-containing protein [Thermosulfurimonas sp. F29]